MKKVKIKNKNIQQNQSGQLAVEGVLIVVLLLSLSLFASKYLRDNEVLAQMISGPWKQISGMMATGNWKDPDKAFDERRHPHLNTMTRVGD